MESQWRGEHLESTQFEEASSYSFCQKVFRIASSLFFQPNSYVLKFSMFSEKEWNYYLENLLHLTDLSVPQTDVTLVAECKFFSSLFIYLLHKLERKEHLDHIQNCCRDLVHSWRRKTLKGIDIKMKEVLFLFFYSYMILYLLIYSSRAVVHLWVFIDFTPKIKKREYSSFIS